MKFLNINKGAVMNSIKNKLVLFVINNFLSGTRFFKIKHKLLKNIGVDIGFNTKIVGPIYFGPAIKISFGENCWIGKNIHIDGCGELVIGNNVDIAPHVVINTGGHEIGDETRRAGLGRNVTIKIGDGTWIGTRVTLVNNINIGKGVVIAAGSVVIDSIENNILVAGIPSKKKKDLYK